MTPGAFSSSSLFLELLETHSRGGHAHGIAAAPGPGRETAGLGLDRHRAGDSWEAVALPTWPPYWADAGQLDG